MLPPREVSDLLRVPAGVPPLVHRASMTHDYGAFAFDFFRSAWWCQRCGVHVTSGPPAAVIPLVAYAGIDSFVEKVQAAARHAVDDADAAPACETCGDAAKLDYADYHAYVSARRAVRKRATRSARPLELLWWSPQDGFLVAMIAEGAKHDFARDALLRAAKAAREAGDVELADRVLEAAAKAIPGDPELLVFMPWLCRRQKTSVAGAIAHAHSRAREHDPEGWYWLAQIGVELVASGTWSKEVLVEVDQHLQRALTIAPTHAQALVAVANVARIRGDETAAIQTLERLLSLHPDHPEGSYTLGLLLLERDPSRALGLFEQGEKAQPRDPDYPRGRARALLAMGRLVEARAAAERAQDLAPDDARVRELMARFA
jgi:tetratricopeptide (TPR) repeat protein